MLGEAAITFRPRPGATSLSVLGLLLAYAPLLPVVFISTLFLTQFGLMSLVGLTFAGAAPLAKKVAVVVLLAMLVHLIHLCKHRLASRAWLYPDRLELSGSLAGGEAPLRLSEICDLSVDPAQPGRLLGRYRRHGALRVFTFSGRRLSLPGRIWDTERLYSEIRSRLNQCR